MLIDSLRRTDDHEQEEEDGEEEQEEKEEEEEEEEESTARTRRSRGSVLEVGPGPALDQPSELPLQRNPRKSQFLKVFSYWRHNEWERSPGGPLPEFWIS